MSKDKKPQGRPKKEPSISNRRNQLRQKWREASNRYYKKITEDDNNASTAKEV
jgi:hypothetical protein